MACRPLIVLALAACVAVLGCSSEETERRARIAAEKVKEALGDTQAAAMTQQASEADVKIAQEALTKAHEYQGEITGKIDSVTVNAVQAFQRTSGLRDDGLLDAATLAALRAVK